METLDLLIIGGGPTGINVGIAAAEANLNFVILEKGVIANSIYYFPDNMTFFSTSKKLEIGGIPFISHGEKPTRNEALEYYRRLIETFRLPIHTFEPVEGMDQGPDGGYVVRTPRQTYRTRAVAVATGFYDTPRLLDVPGEDLPKVRHYYDNPHPYVGKKVLVVGAANSACDAALETYYKGAEVTMAVRGEDINPRVKYWIRPNIVNRIKEGSIKAHFRTKVKAIHPDRVDLEGPDGPFTIENDFVLAMTGYRPNFEFINSLGIACTGDRTRIVHQPDTLETNLPNVFLAGVACSGLETSKLFIENTRDHGEIIVGRVSRLVG